MAKKSPRKTGKAKTSRKRTVESFPLVGTGEIVPIPGLVFPVTPTDSGEIEAIRLAIEEGSPVVVAATKTGGAGKPRKLCQIGGLANIVHSLRLPNGDMRIKVHVQGRVRIDQITKRRPHTQAEVTLLQEPTEYNLSSKQLQVFENVKEKIAALAEFEPGLEEHLAMAREIFEPGALADLGASIIPLETSQAQKVLELIDPLKRISLVDELLSARIDSMTIKERISTRAEKELGKAHHQELLREQVRQLRIELGEAHDFEDELNDLKKQLEKLRMPAHAKKEATKQLQRLQQLHPDTAEAALARTYIDWIIDLPWSRHTKDRLEIAQVQQILNEDHYGLEKTKERVLDFLGVRKLKQDLRGPVLLFVGPPGVGKTSLGRSIARALGREFVRVSVGGLRDEAELRGHRRTYVGAMPGRIIQGLKTAKTKNPVFMLDEIDKIGSDFRGDPASVLLEILDPEQNSSFEDHYLNIPFDLSEVMFIATANMTDTIPGPLLDRLEMIEIPGYTNEEKLQISRHYLVPQAKKDNGLEDQDIAISDQTLLQLINGYTRESGVRDLGRQVSTMFRKAARQLAEGNEPPRRIQPKHCEEYLGPLKFTFDQKNKADEIGLVMGLAWTQVGGELLPIEVSITKGKGSLSLTGQMGEVMRESAMAALTYVLSNAERLGFDPKIYDESNVHIHIPHGGIPKDGPSAGVAIATVLVSIFTKRPVSRDVAMTGEVTLRGAVLQIGGLREKALAALRAGIPYVIIPKENERELVEFPSYLLEQVRFIPVESVDQVLEAALVWDSEKKITYSRVGLDRPVKRGEGPRI